MVWTQGGHTKTTNMVEHTPTNRTMEVLDPSTSSPDDGGEGRDGLLHSSYLTTSVGFDSPRISNGSLNSQSGTQQLKPQVMGSMHNEEFALGSSSQGTINRNDMLREISFGHGGADVVSGHQTPYSSGLAPAPVHNREISNQSTIDSGITTLSANSRTMGSNFMNDSASRRMFGRGASNRSTGGGVMESDQSIIEKQRRVNLLMGQCENVRFPFKKKLILANMNLSYDEVPVEHICSDRLGVALYKLSLAGNPIFALPEILIVKLNGLRILDLSQCELRTLPETWNLPSLKVRQLFSIVKIYVCIMC